MHYATRCLLLSVAQVIFFSACIQGGTRGGNNATPQPSAAVPMPEQPPSKLPYRFFEPPGWQAPGTPDPVAGGQRYPLVLFLHGAGERGTDNQAQLLHGVSAFTSSAGQSKRPAFVAAPQCPSGAWWDEADEMEAVQVLIDDLLRLYPIDPERVYITGLSMGGYGTWRAILDRPGRFAAAIPICGAGDPTQAARLIELPIWAFHGALDEIVDVEVSRDMIQAIEAAGGKPRYREYEDVRHDSWTQTYEDEAVLEWLFAQRRDQDGDR